MLAFLLESVAELSFRNLKSCFNQECFLWGNETVDAFSVSGPSRQFRIGSWQPGISSEIACQEENLFILILQSAFFMTENDIEAS
jgi:hypothetical protein